MAEHIIIDGNNLMYALHEHAPGPAVGRETLVKVIERWAGNGKNEITLVFDGPEPRGGLSKQMTSSRIAVEFSAPVTADDVIVEMVERVKDPGRVRVVTSDRAIRHAAGLNRCRHTDARAFVDELFASPKAAHTPSSESDPKPRVLTPQERREWLDSFGISDDEEPFDGHEAMMH